jgi:hypothetical protein
MSFLCVSHLPDYGLAEEDETCRLKLHERKQHNTVVTDGPVTSPVYSTVKIQNQIHPHYWPFRFYKQLLLQLYYYGCGSDS